MATLVRCIKWLLISAALYLKERREGGRGGGVRAETDGSVYSPPTVDHNH